MEMNENDLILIQDAVMYTETLKALLPSLRHEMARQSVITDIANFSAEIEMFRLTLATLSKLEQNLPIQPSLIDDISSCGGTI